MKNQQNAQTYFLTGQVFFHPLEILTSQQVHSAVKQILFPKGKNKSKFPMVNLCNGGTKDFVELCEIIHSEISAHFSIRQTKLFWINSKYYSQTCSDDHLCKMTSCLRRPMLSPPKWIPIQSLLYKMTSCLMELATTFFVSQMKNSI